MKKKLLLGLGLMAWVAASVAVAEKKYDPGASDTEIKIGAEEVLILRESDVLAKVVGDRAAV